MAKAGVQTAHETQVITLRVSAELAERIESYRAELSRKRPDSTAPQSDAVRALILAGLDALGADAGEALAARVAHLEEVLRVCAGLATDVSRGSAAADRVGGEIRRVLEAGRRS